MLYVDSDNAMGSPSGDVDDGFALAALLRGRLPIAGIGSVFGNTTEEHAFHNNRALAQLCGYQGLCLRGAARPAMSSEVSRFLLSTPVPLRVVALGPLTNVAAACQDPLLPRKLAEVVIVGGNASSHGRWPPIWPFEFNLVRDWRATRTVLRSELPLTIVPLDVARGMRVTRQDLREVGGAVGGYVRQHAERWFRRARLLFWSGSVPMWDLAAALYVMEPALFKLREAQVEQHDNGWLEFGKGSRTVRLVEDFDRDACWRCFVRLVGGNTA